MPPTLSGRLGGQSTRGERKGTARLTERDVLMIKASSEPDSVLAHKLGVHRTCIGKIRTGQNWGWLE